MRVIYRATGLIPVLLLGCLACFLASARADLIFVPSLDSQGNISVLWSSVGNWYLALSPTPIPANRLPGADDTVDIELSEFDCVVDVPSVEVATINAEANIVGGNFAVTTINSTKSYFNGSTITLQGTWTSSGDNIINANVTVKSGALLFISPSNSTSVNNSTLYDVGQIEVMDGGMLDFSGGTNFLTVTSNAQFTGVGNAQLIDGAGVPLTIDNNGYIQSQDGDLYIQSEDIFWTNSTGKGCFTNLTSNAMIEIDGPFAVQTSCTNFFNGLVQFDNATTATINGILQVGTPDPNPGILDFHGIALNGTGAVNFTGSPGMPSTLIWESGTFEGPPVNIDSNSQLIITNILGKTLRGSVINNAGVATWLIDGNDITMDDGAVFNNLSTGVFNAENSAAILGNNGSNASYFYNAGTFRKSVSSNAVNFTQDNYPAPSVYLLNQGLVDVQTGALYLEWGTNSGQYIVAQGAQLHFWVGTNVQESTAAFTGPGFFAIESADFWLESSVSVDNLQMDLNGEIDGPGDLTIEGLLTLSSGTVQGTGALNIAPDGSMVISTNPVTLYRNVNNSGTTLVTNSGVLAGQPLTWNDLPGSSLNLAGGSLGNTIGYSGPPPVLNNAGSLSNAGPNVITTTVNWTVTNSGNIVVYPYALDLNQSLVQTAGSTQVNSNATLSVSSEFQNTFQILGGVLEGQGLAGGTIINSASIHPGDSPGILSLGFGTLTNLPGAQLAVDIGGTAPGTQFGQLNSSGGVAWLNNLALNVTLDGGFAPSVGQSFVIWTNGQLRGQFASVIGNQYSNIVLTPEYSGSTVTLVALPELTPSFASNTFMFSFGTTAGQTNLIQYTPSLTPTDWQNISTNLGTGQILTFIDPSATNAARFYRVIAQ